MNNTKAFIFLLVLCFVLNISGADPEQSLMARWNLVINVAGVSPGFVHILVLVHNAMYNALTFYDPKATSDPFIDIPCRPEEEWTTENKEVAISYAAYYTMIELLPDFKVNFDEFMETLGLDIQTVPNDITTPAGIGARCAYETLKARENDNSNLLGNLNPSGIPYSEPILLPGYKPFKTPNTVDKLKNINYWQPLRNPDGSAQTYVTVFDTVRPFALSLRSQFRPKKAPKRTFTNYKGFVAQFQKLYEISLNLTPEERLIALFWDGRLESGLNVWHALTARVAAIKNYTLDEEVKLFFAESVAILDACIASFDTKKHYRSVRPITAIRHYFDPNWVTVIPTPPHPDFTSTHAAVVGAIAKVFQEFTGSDCFGGSYTDAETGITLTWDTFSKVSWEAGISRLYAGIHTEDAFRRGQKQGTSVGRVVWKKLKHLFGRDN